MSDAWEALDWHIDEQEALRRKIAEKLEEASHTLQFCEEASEVASVLVDLFNEIVKVLKGEER